ncbi:hypothetical protein V6N13_093376 [Hibiscus sabdariffa]
MIGQLGFSRLQLLVTTEPLAQQPRGEDGRNRRKIGEGKVWFSSHLPEAFHDEPQAKAASGGQDSTPETRVIQAVVAVTATDRR